MDKPLTARDRLLHAAAALFYNDGIAATGIDTITRRAGVAKQSLYNNFASKSDLVAAYVEARHAEWLALHDRRQAVARGPKARVLAVFDAYADHAEDAYERGFRGCGLLNAAAELTADDPARAAIRRHKGQVQDILMAELAQLVADPDRRQRLGDHLSYLLEGSITRAGLDGDSRRVHDARAMAAEMLEALA